MSIQHVGEGNAGLSRLRKPFYNFKATRNSAKLQGSAFFALLSFPVMAKEWPERTFFSD